MPNAEENLSGAQKAAIFLLGLGEEGAASIMKHMDPREVQSVGEAMAGLPTISAEQFSSVASEFTDNVNQVDPNGIGAEDFTRRVMVQALGENRARSMLSKVMQKPPPKGVEALRWMDSRSVASLIKNEHPQIQAIVLTALDGDHAAKTLMRMPEDSRHEIVARVAQLDKLDAAAMMELDAILEKQLGSHQNPPPTTIDGVTLAAGMLNSLDTEVEKGILDAIGEIDEELVAKISDLMFVFEDLLSLDDRGMQRLLREVATDLLSKALKGSTAKMMSKFLDNMSSRAAEMLRDDIDAMGPIKLAEVEEAQKEILTAAAKLSEDGEIMLGNKGGDDFV